MESKLKQACRMLWDTHAAVWTYFDPELDKGDALQPLEIKLKLQEIVEFVRKHHPDLLVDWDAAE